MGPYGPGGYEFHISFVTPRLTFILAIAFLSWGIGFGRVENPETVILHIGPIKFQVQKAVWVGDAV